MVKARPVRSSSELMNDQSGRPSDGFCGGPLASRHENHPPRKTTLSNPLHPTHTHTPLLERVSHMELTVWAPLSGGQRVAEPHFFLFRGLTTRSKGAARWNAVAEVVAEPFEAGCPLVLFGFCNRIRVFPFLLSIDSWRISEFCQRVGFFCGK